MKKVLAIILMAIAVTAVFVSCDDPKHEHSYGDWQSDATNHWKECSCGEKTEEAAHIFGGNTVKDGKVVQICGVCNREKEITDAKAVVDTASFQAAIKADGVNTIVLANDIALTEIITVTKTIVLDMNGKTISLDNGTNSAGEIIVEGTGNLTVSGNGKTTFTGNYYENASNKVSGYIFSVKDNATLTIEDGEHYGCMGVLQIGRKINGVVSTDETCKAYIKGGTFSSKVLYSNRYWTLNKMNGSEGEILVSGGSFVDFDPGAPKTDDSASYLAEGYEVTSETKDSKKIYTVSKKATE